MAAHLLTDGDRGAEGPLYNVDHLLELWDEIHARAPRGRALARRRAERATAHAGSRAATTSSCTAGCRASGRSPRRPPSTSPSTRARRTPASARPRSRELIGLGVPIVSYDYEVTADVREAGAGLLVADAARVRGRGRLADPGRGRALALLGRRRRARAPRSTGTSSPGASRTRCSTATCRRARRDRDRERSRTSASRSAGSSPNARHRQPAEHAPTARRAVGARAACPDRRQRATPTSTSTRDGRGGQRRPERSPAASVRAGTPDAGGDRGAAARTAARPRSVRSVASATPQMPTASASTRTGRRSPPPRAISVRAMLALAGRGR